MAIEAILFDLGKVLIDFNFTTTVEALASTCSKSAAEFDRVLRDPALAVRYDCGNLTTLQFYEHLREFGGLTMEIGAFRSAWSSMFLPGLLVSDKLLKTLWRRYPLILVSNTNEAHLEYLSAHYDVFAYFVHKVFSFEVGAMKPDRRIYDRAMALSGKRPESLIFIDDREENVLGARELGMHAHQFKSEAGLIAALGEVGVEPGDVVEGDPLNSRS